MKFDNAPRSRDCVEVQTRQRWAAVDPWHSVWVVGSTQDGEEKLALKVYQQLSIPHEELRLVLVPRHPERFDQVDALIKSFGFHSHRRTSKQSLEPTGWNSNQVILIDTIGELRFWWGVGSISTVGGSFGDRGGQNMLEPAGYGNAISFGPNTRNFAEISKRLLEAEAAVRVADQQELQEFVKRCVCDVPAADSLGRAAQNVVAEHRGATRRTIEAIASLLGTPNQPHRTAA